MINLNDKLNHIITSIVISDEVHNDVELENELKRFNIERLYPKFLEAGVTFSDLWELDDDMIAVCNLRPIEKIKYEKAKEKKLAAN